MIIQRNNILYYLSFMLFLFVNYIGHSGLSLRYIFFLGIRVPALVFILLILGTKILSDLRTKNQLFIFSGLILLTAFIAYNMKSTFAGLNIMTTLFFILGLKDIPIKNLLRIWLWEIGGLMIVTYISYKLGIVGDVFGYRDGILSRYSLGYIFNTLPANYFFQFTVIYLFYREKKIKLIEMLFLLLINYRIYIYTDTKSAFYFSILALFVFLLVKYIKIPNSLINFINRYLILLAIFIPLFLSYNYGSGLPIYVTLNRILTDRLMLGYRALNEYGFSWFGQPIQIVIGEQVSQFNKYFYIDSSFLSIAVRQGIIFLFLIVIAYIMLSSHKAIKNNLYYMLSFAVITLHGMFDPQFIELVYNPLLLFLGLLFYSDENYELNSEERFSPIGNGELYFDKN